MWDKVSSGNIIGGGGLRVEVVRKERGKRRKEGE